MWLPWDDGTGPWAVVLDRSPYGPDGTELLADLFLPYGMVAVSSQERATGQSEGNWTFWATAASDDQDTLAWIRRQSWANGKVFQMGFSADGIMTTLAAMLPQKIDAQWVGWTASQPYYVAFQGGAQRAQLTQHWLSHMHAYRRNTPPYIDTLLNHEAWSQWWDGRTMDAPSMLKDITWPGVWWMAQYDIFAQTGLDAFGLYQDHSGAAGKQKLLFNTRGHCVTSSAAGSADPSAHDALTVGKEKPPRFFFPLDRLGDLWSYEQAVNLFKSIDTGDASYNAFEGIGRTSAADLKAYTIYVLGPQNGTYGAHGNYYTTLDAFPMGTPTPLYLAPSGVLSKTKPGASNAVAARYIYDPSDPVPSIGGNNLFMPCGPLPQNSLNSRKDILTWTTEPFSEDTAFAGRIKVTLYVSSNATDTDFTVRITDVYPDGAETLLTDTIQRMRWRESDTTPSHMTPGQIYAIDIECWTMVQILPAGHSLALHVSSSNYPRFSVNPNNGLLLNQTGPSYIAQNAVFYGGPQAMSVVQVPFIPLSSLPNNVDTSGFHVE